MKIPKYVFLVLLFQLYQSACFAQDAHDPLLIVEDRDETIQEFSQAFNVSIDRLKQLNPTIKANLHKGDTIYVRQVQKKVEGLNADSQILDKNGLFKAIEFLDKHYFVFEVDPHKYKIELFNQVQNNGEPYDFNSIGRSKGKDLIFAMNGGMFEQDLSPVGLYISDGVMYTPINLKKGGRGNFYQLQPSGVFMIDSNDNARVMSSESFSPEKYKTKLATQSGPMLLINGTFNKNFQENSTNFNIRNGVGVNKKNNIVFVVSFDPVNFYEFSQFFKQRLNCDNALYLDGVVSQYFAPEIDKQPRSGMELGVFIAVSNKSTGRQDKMLIPKGRGTTAPAAVTPVKPAPKKQNEPL